MKLRSHLSTALGLFACAAFLSPASSAQTFTRIIGTGDAVPGGAFPLLTLQEAPCLDGDHIAFLGSYQNLTGFVTAVFSNAGGSFAAVARTGDIMPTEAVPFEFIGRLTSDGGNISFTGSSFVGLVNRTGIYTNATGALTELVDLNDFIPGGSGRFLQVANLDFTYGGGNVVFNGSGNFGQRGIYAVDESGGLVRRVVDGNTQVPGEAQGTTFSTFGTPSVYGDRVVFVGSRTVFGGSGVYEQYGVGSGPLSIVADTNQNSPNGTPFTLFGYVAADEDHTMFQGYTGQGVGIYFQRGAARNTIADTATPVPGGSGTFPEFSAAASSRGRVVFRATDFNTGQELGIFSNYCGTLQPILAPGDMLGGLTVRSVLIDQESLDGDKLAANVQFTDGSAAIYRIDLSRMENYGTGFASAGNSLPTIAGVGCPRRAAPIELQLRGGPDAAFGWLVYGLAPDSTPFPGGGTILARPDAMLPINLATSVPGKNGGWLDIGFVIPGGPVLSGTTFHVQAVLDDPLFPGNWSLTDGLRMPIP